MSLIIYPSNPLASFVGTSFRHTGPESDFASLHLNWCLIKRPPHSSARRALARLLPAPHPYSQLSLKLQAHIHNMQSQVILFLKTHINSCLVQSHSQNLLEPLGLSSSSSLTSFTTSSSSLTPIFSLTYTSSFTFSWVTLSSTNFLMHLSPANPKLPACCPSNTPWMLLS